MDELKPCPFCGNTPNDIEVWERAAECLQCGVKVHAETWEQRPIEDALNAELAQQNELRRMEAEALAGVGKEVERLLRARIAALEAQLTPIPFSERTPDRYGTFMFYSRAGWWSSAWYSDITQEIILREYTHWLPMPPAPEESA